MLGRAGDATTRIPALWIGFAFQTGGLILAGLDPTRRDFLYAVLGVWAGVASLLFATRYLAGPSRGLLALPIGCMALLVAMTSFAGPEAPRSGGSGGSGAIGI